eukprot:3041726-Heterocapsa_arctica.AAC.1
MEIRRGGGRPCGRSGGRPWWRPAAVGRGGHNRCCCGVCVGVGVCAAVLLCCCGASGGWLA